MKLIAPDLVRGGAALSVVGASLTDGAIGFAVMFLVLGGCMVPRALGLTPGLDALICATLVVDAWAALLDWYLHVPGLDLVVHAVTTGLVALLVRECLARIDRLAAVADRWSALGVAAAVVTSAMVLAGVWEVAEWLAHAHLDERIQVGVVDTATDLVAGLAGSLVVGWQVTRGQHHEVHPQPEVVR